MAIYTWIHTDRGQFLYRYLQSMYNFLAIRFRSKLYIYDFQIVIGLSLIALVLYPISNKNCKSRICNTIICKIIRKKDLENTPNITKKWLNFSF